MLAEVYPANEMGTTMGTALGCMSLGLGHHTHYLGPTLK